MEEAPQCRCWAPGTRAGGHRAAARASPRARGARPAAGPRPRRVRRRPGRPRRPRRRQDGAARLRGRGRPGDPSAARPGSRARWSSPFAAVQQLCAPILDLVERLPAPQRDALDVAFGLSAGPPPNPFLVGLAVLGLLSEAAEQRPLLCLVDDAQWLDRARRRRLAFVARRLLAEKIALVFATREVGRRARGLAGAPRRAARASRRPGAPGVGPAGAHSTSRCLNGSSSRRMAIRSRCWSCRAADADAARRWLRPAAALAVDAGSRRASRGGWPALPADAPPCCSWPRPTRPAIPRSSGGPPSGSAPRRRRAGFEADGLLALGPRVVFRHPLVRSAVYRASGPRSAARSTARSPRRPIPRSTRTAAPGTGPRRPWPDEDVAAELERSAARAQARGGFAAAAAFLERSSVLTLDPARRAGRALAAAAGEAAGGRARRGARAARARGGRPARRVQRAQADVLRARIAFATDRGSDAPRLLLAAARRLEPWMSRLAREIYLDALTAALFAGRLAGAADAQQVATAARAARLPRRRHARRTSCSTGWRC